MKKLFEIPLGPMAIIPVYLGTYKQWAKSDFGAVTHPSARAVCVTSYEDPECTQAKKIGIFMNIDMLDGLLLSSVVATCAHEATHATERLVTMMGIDDEEARAYITGHIAAHMFHLYEGHSHKSPPGAL